MLSRKEIYSLAGIQYNEAKFQLEKQIFVPKQLNTPKNPSNDAALRLQKWKFRENHVWWHVFVSGFGG